MPKRTKFLFTWKAVAQPNGFKGRYRVGFRAVIQSLVFLFSFRPQPGRPITSVNQLSPNKFSGTGVLIPKQMFCWQMKPSAADLVKLYPETLMSWLLALEQLSQKRRSFKDDLYDYRKRNNYCFKIKINRLIWKACQVNLHKQGFFSSKLAFGFINVFSDELHSAKPLFVIKELIESARWKFSMIYARFI